MTGSTWRKRWQGEGGGGELLRLAWPLILSNSFWTLQIVLDRILLSWTSSAAVGASQVAAVLFWTTYLLAQHRSEQERVAAEVQRLAPSPENAAEILLQLTYTRAVVDEALRLYPPAFAIVGIVSGAGRLQLDTHTSAPFFRASAPR